MTENVPRILIVGGGFGGLGAAKALRNTPASIVLLDRTNHHLFQPFTAARDAIKLADV
jgi:NADH dehydrogenase FAD-containing subunit